MRRMRTLTCGLNQPLKLGISKRLLLTHGMTHQSVLLRNTHRAPNENEYSLQLWAQFDTSDFDGISVITHVEKDAEVMSGANCSVSVYSVSNDNLWTETLLETASGVPQSDGRFICNISAAQLGVDLDGEVTLSVRASIQRGDKVLKKKIYLNHLGVYDSIIRLRNKVKFLEVLKKDQGT